MSESKNTIIRLALTHPKMVSWLMAVSTIILLSFAALPTIWPGTFPALNSLRIDTDPENMLSSDEPVRVFHNQMKAEFGLSDMVVVGIVNNEHPDGVFNPASLGRIHELTDFASKLQWPDPEDADKTVGVISVDMMAPSMVDNILQSGLGSVSFEWLMPSPPETKEQALAVRDHALNIPTLNGTLVNEGGTAISLYLPLTDKHLSYQVREAILDKTATWSDSGDEFHITGLPVAEDTFGVEMFIQMAISAPAAMGVIFLLMWWFFKNVRLVISPMLVAMASSMSVMGLLVATGNTVHIMSSMIPIFIMPIAVLDAVHILSEFFDRYQKTGDRRATIIAVMNELYKPMLYTSLTTTVGFASLALTPIPPVQTFGFFVGFGVMLAWFWTITFVPAFILFIPEAKLKGFGLAHGESNDSLSRSLLTLGRFSHSRPRIILIGVMAVVALTSFGISKIVINDNPIKWFESDHDIRIADRVLNEHFAGTYMSYLALLPSGDSGENFQQEFTHQLAQIDSSVIGDIKTFANSVDTKSRSDFFIAIQQFVEAKLDESSDEMFDVWDEMALFVDAESRRTEVFKQPEVLRYIENLQAALLESGMVGKSNSIADVVKTVHREMLLGEPEQFRIPDTVSAVAQTLLSYQNSHRPYDLWHLVTPDYTKSTIWIQLKSGDNVDMSKVVAMVDEYVTSHPLPAGLTHHWYGLTYINVVWQDRMVSGMMDALIGSFVVVLIMMIILFRSIWWGLLSMAPLSISVGLIYGIVGLIGKDYDMPVAVLSSLALGLAVDYAIHFLSRSRDAIIEYGSWKAAIDAMFGEPARAISRNAVVLGVGFLPLLFAPLIPYNTVGVLIASILVIAGMATLLILPALITLLEPVLFKKTKGA
jgi:uncharacterized protein